MIYEYTENGKTLYGFWLAENGAITIEREGFETIKEAQIERDKYFSDEIYFD